MRVMVLVKATKESEAGVLPSRELLGAMGKFNDELQQAGMLLAGDGLRASAKGARITFSGAQRAVEQGPFGNTAELVSGYWVWKVNAMDDAIQWARRAPMPDGSQLEIRQLAEAEDFAAA